MPPRKKTQKQLVPVGSIQPPTEFKGEYNQSELDKRNLNGLGSAEDNYENLDEIRKNSIKFADKLIESGVWDDMKKDAINRNNEQTEITNDHLVVDDAHLNDKIEEMAENLTETQQLQIVPYLEKEVANAIQEEVQGVTKKKRAPRKSKKQLEKEVIQTVENMPEVGTKEHQKKVKKLQKGVKKVIKSKNMNKEEKIKLIRELEKELHGMLKDYKKMRGQILKLRVSAMVARRLIVKEELLINEKIFYGPKTRLRPREKSKLAVEESKYPVSPKVRQNQIKKLQSLGWTYKEAMKILKNMAEIRPLKKNKKIKIEEID